MLVFVYGTLMPGHVRWPTIRSAVVASRPARVPGELYDTGAGYPAASLVPADGRAGPVDRAAVVDGWVLEVESSRSERLLALLDRIEGTQYERVEVVTTDGERAVAYRWSGALHGLRPLPEGWTLALER